MDVSSPRDKAESFKSLSKGLVHGLDGDRGKLLDIKDSSKQNICDRVAVSHVEEVFEDLKLDDTKHDHKSLSKYATFPLTAKVLPSATYSNEQDEDGDFEMALKRLFFEETVHSRYSRSISLPTSLKLVSAMKGSRERQGELRRNLTVKWAPDVYDPPPSIVSHTVNRSKKQQKLKEERNSKQKKGKKARKGSSSHGGSKDKKPVRKIGGRSTDGSCKLMDARDGVVELTDGFKDFVVAGPDSYCGSSFLKESLSKVHYSVAEAL